MHRSKFFLARVTRVFCAVFVAYAILAGTIFDGSTVGFSTAVAQKKEKPKGRKTEAMSQSAYEAIIKSQEFMEADQWSSALQTINSLLSRQGSLKGIDIATAYKFRGYVYAGQENYAAAAKDFETAINTGALADWDMLDMRYNLAQLYLGMEQYNKAILNLELWFRDAENPGAQAMFLAAQAYALVRRMNEAENYADRGVRKMEEVGEVRESWYRVASVIYMQREKYSKAQPILEKLIRGWSDKKEYYIQLSGIYQERGRERDSFAVLALAYDNKLALTSDEIVRVAQLYRLYDYPYKAAKIVEKEINAGRVKKNKKNWEELGNAWFQSREMKKAVQPLTNAAGMAKDGDIYLRLCQTHASDEAWSRAARDCNKAINKGGLKTNGGLAYQLLAIARYEEGDREGAMKAFDKCQDWERTEKDCRTWYRYVQQEIQYEAAEEERQQAVTEEQIQRRLEQEEEIRRTLQNVGQVFGEDNISNSGVTPAEEISIEDALRDIDITQ